MDTDTLFGLAKPYLEKNDFGAVHTQRVLEIANKYFEIPAGEKALLQTAIVLHDIGGSSVTDQYTLGPKIARQILTEHKCSQDFIDEVCQIIVTHHDHPENPSLVFKILYDADHLVMLSPEEFFHYDIRPRFNWLKIINDMYHEQSRQIAQEMLQKRRRETSV